MSYPMIRDKYPGDPGRFAELIIKLDQLTDLHVSFDRVTAADLRSELDDFLRAPSSLEQPPPPKARPTTRRRKAKRR